MNIKPFQPTSTLYSGLQKWEIIFPLRVFRSVKVNTPSRLPPEETRCRRCFLSNATFNEEYCILSKHFFPSLLRFGYLHRLARGFGIFTANAAISRQYFYKVQSYFIFLEDFFRGEKKINIGRGFLAKPKKSCASPCYLFTCINVFSSTDAKVPALQVCYWVISAVHMFSHAVWK